MKMKSLQFFKIIQEKQNKFYSKTGQYRTISSKIQDKMGEIQDIFE